jgi:HTH-type transcriptional regulator, sugar sensing transcriptional regulator
MIEALRNIGLTDSEIKVYFALLELGTTTKGPIVHKSGVASSKIYELLDKLIEKGLVSYVIKANTKYFEAASPKRILDYLKEKELQLKERTKDIEKVLPELLLKQKMVEKKQEVNVYEGLKGIKTVREKSFDDLKKGDEFYLLGASASSNNMLRDYWMHYHKKRSKLGIGVKMLMNHDAPQNDLDERNVLSHTSVKYMPTDISTPSWIEIIKDRTVIGVASDNPVAVEIKNKEVADSFKSYFDSLWNQETTVSKGMDAFKNIFDTLLKENKPGETYRVLGAGLGTDKTEKQFIDLFTDFHKKRIKKGVKADLLFHQSAKERLDKVRGEYYDDKGAKIKFLPYDDDFPMQIIPHKDKTFISTQDKDPIVITINNKQITDAFRRYIDNVWNQDVRVYKGIEQINNTFWEMLNELNSGEEYYVLGANWHGKKDVVQQFFKDFHKKRIKKGVKANLLFLAGTEKKVKEYKQYYGVNAEVKFLPEGSYEGMQINLYKNKVLFFVWRDKEPLVFVIEDKNVYNTFKSYFDSYWNQETRIIKGVDAVQELFEDMLRHGKADYIGARGYLIDERPEFIDDWEKRAIKQGFKLRNIVDPETKGHRITKFPFVKTKYTLKKEFSMLSVFWIYGNKVAISNWTEKEPIVFLIENKQFHDMYQQQFEMLWNS